MGRVVLTKSFEFLFDFGGPNSYLAHKVLSDFCAQNGAEAVYVPVLLGGLFKLTNNKAPMVAFAEIPAKTAYMRREMTRFMARHAIPGFQMNPHFPVNTLMAMRGAVAAERLGLAEPYVEALMQAMWEQGLKLDDPAVLGAALISAGLPAQQLFELAQDQAVKDALAANTQRSARSSISARIRLARSRRISLAECALSRPGRTIAIRLG
jgi:2-hydroxychromene-2-carboxylate isomerase